MRANASVDRLYRQYKKRRTPTLQVRLRQALAEHQQRTGQRLTYSDLAKATGLSYATLASLATRPTYNTRLSTVAKLCAALACRPGDLLELVSGEKAHGDRH